MLLVGLVASDAALPVLASADDKPGLAGTTGLVTAVAAGVLESLAASRAAERSMALSA
jgi:hypothetical protein